jgi:DNA polymerase III subunit delta'
MNLESFNQTKLHGLDFQLTELINLYDQNDLPNKILLSGQKGNGKCTLAYHLINYILSKNESHAYDKKNFLISENNKSYRLILNKSNPNFSLIDVIDDKKTIDIKQIRELIFKVNKSSFNNLPRFVLIDNIELLNTNSINALLKIVEEPSTNTYFILINNNKKILPTLTSRCLNFKIFLTHYESVQVANKLLGDDIYHLINKDLLNYYITPGNIYNLSKFAEINNLDLRNFILKDFLSLIIEKNFYKKDMIIKGFVYDLIEFYLNKKNSLSKSNISKIYSYFLNRISNTKKFNLDDESLMIEFENIILNE